MIARLVPSTAQKLQEKLSNVMEGSMLEQNEQRDWETHINMASAE